MLPLLENVDIDQQLTPACTFAFHLDTLYGQSKSLIPLQR